ncbi:MAG TPA: TrkH family potassium uptake protein [Phycisphaerales bacterium]|nr:TrkH family potassium uptake protein [Phycisphaerales bacterium]
MNLQFVVAQWGRMSLLLGGLLALVAAIFIAVPGDGGRMIDPAEISMLVSGGIAGVLGAVGWLWGRHALIRQGASLNPEEGSMLRPYRMTRRDAALVTTGAWVLGAAIAGLPFLIWARFSGGAPDSHPFQSVIDCYFEAMSGLTTTGASILTDIEAVPRSLLMWRSLTQWLGGLGILVLFVAILPGLGTAAKKLFRIESPGPDPEGLRPTIKQTARRLWMLYVSLTAAQGLLLLCTGMGLFDAANHAFTTMATGGFSTRNTSIARPESLGAEIVLMAFMVLAGSNFTVLLAMLRGRWKAALGDTEFRVYLLCLVGGSVLVTAALLGADQPLVLTDGIEVPLSGGEAARGAAFTVISQQTTTGFSTFNFDLWPFAAKAMIIVLMFVGGSAGSTAGGVKVIRIWIALRVLLAELERFFRPDVVRPLKVGGHVIDQEQKLNVMTYLLGTIALLAAGAIAIQALESHRSACDFSTAATASLATICTVGPGLNQVGAINNYGWFSDPSKLVLCLLMLIGRLEVFVILVLLSPRFWRSH